MEWQSFVATIVAFFSAKRSISSRTEGTILPPSYPSLFAPKSYGHSKAAAVLNKIRREEVVLTVDEEQDVAVRNRCEIEGFKRNTHLLEQIRVFFVQRHGDESNNEVFHAYRCCFEQTNPLSPTDPQSHHSRVACTA